MKVLSTQEMRLAEQTAITSFGISSLTLMESAGKGVAREVYEYLKKIRLYDCNDSAEKYFSDCNQSSIIKSNRLPQNLCNKRFGQNWNVLVFAGTGNNGGDGFVAARYLALCGIKILVIISGDRSKFSPDAKINFNKLEGLGVAWQRWEDTDPLLLSHDAILVVDAIFGTGISRDVSFTVKEMISWINKSSLPVISVDIPSGICSDTGKVLGEAVRSSATVTMGAVKKGLLLYPGRDFTGDIVIIDIGLPDNSYAEASAETLVVCEAKELIPKRAADAHKGSCGRLLVIGGSVGMVGAPALTCLGALRAGAGFVAAAIPETITSAFHPILPEAISIPIPLTINGSPDILSKELLSQLERFQAVVIGPGMKLDLELLKKFLQYISVPIVLDAGALSILNDEVIKDLSSYNNNIVITPHEGELGKIIGKDPNEIRDNRFNLVKELSDRWPVTLVLKGAATLVGNKGFPVFINSSGNSSMATPGSGDVLGGVIGTFLAQAISSRDAACLGVFVHGLAGDNVLVDIGETGVLASEIADALPFVFQNMRCEVEQGRRMCYNQPGMNFEKIWRISV